MRGTMPMRRGTRGFNMAGSKLISGKSRLVAAALALGMAAGGAVIGTGFLSPDRLLERSYARSAPLGPIFLDEIVAESDRHVPVTKAAIRAPAPPALVVDGVAVHSNVLTEPLAIGSRVRLVPGDPRSREVEVLDAAEVNAPVVGLPGVRLQLVTARPVDGRDDETLRLIFTIRDGGVDKLIPGLPERVAGKVL
jgi:hypothetical protein